MSSRHLAALAALVMGLGLIGGPPGAAVAQGSSPPDLEPAAPRTPRELEPVNDVDAHGASQEPSLDETAKPDRTPASKPVIELVRWVLTAKDNGGLPFVVVDKSWSEIFVFDSDGLLLGATPALLGVAIGDDSVPGIGDRPLSSILPQERTTPAGRFVAAYGPAEGGRTVLWVDYETAISLHPVVTSNPKEQRLKRLASSAPEDNRITYGCINVPADFYRTIINPAFTGSKGVVYVLPESKPLNEVFPAVLAFAAQGRIGEDIASVPPLEDALTALWTVR